MTRSLNLLTGGMYFETSITVIQLYQEYLHLPHKREKEENDTFTVNPSGYGFLNVCLKAGICYTF